jgi:succinate-semialdehyde dehydrogenase/glutarate-semialdehyde dehydrogenase
MALTKDLYGPIFGDAVGFCGGTGKSLIEDSLTYPQVTAAVAFGFDENILPYEEAFRVAGKKLVFEGPGQDPFIVFVDADLDLALDDLMASNPVYAIFDCLFHEGKDLRREPLSTRRVVMERSIGLIGIPLNFRTP